MRGALGSDGKHSGIQTATSYLQAFILVFLIRSEARAHEIDQHSDTEIMTQLCTDRTIRTRPSGAPTYAINLSHLPAPLNVTNPTIRTAFGDHLSHKEAGAVAEIPPVESIAAFRPLLPISLRNSPFSYPFVHRLEQAHKAQHSLPTLLSTTTRRLPQRSLRIEP